jgi:SAM-dependent methyltransferase
MPREQRLVFGEVADLYDQARPSYPSALIDHLAELAGPAPDHGRVLDVGCGTAKATVLLAAHRLNGIGLEPDPDMAAVARQNLAPFPPWTVVSGEFETFSPVDERFDLITCAQAWHWLDPAVRFGHAAQLLHPGGWLALFWNRTAQDDSAVRRDIDAVYAELFPTLSPHGWLTIGQPPVGTPPPGCGLGDHTWQVFPWVQRYTTKQWTDLVQTHSDHRLLAPEQRDILLGRLTAAIDAHGGVFDHPYDCWLWTARRL